MNAQEIKAYLDGLKSRTKHAGKFSRDEIAMLELIAKTLLNARQKQAVGRDAGPEKFDFALRAQIRYDRLTHALIFLEKLTEGYVNQ
jgi:hypothetical protein